MKDLSSYRVDGRIAAVTGAAGEIGLAIARHLGAMGATIALVDLSAERLEAARAQLASEGIECRPFTCDVTSEALVTATVAAIIDAFGGCDILVNNAGLLHKAASLEVLDETVWTASFDVNAKGVFLCTKHFGSAMLTSGRGSIINIGSTTTAQPSGSAGYGCSKQAAIGLMRQAAVEWGPRGVRANAVSPGFILTALSEHLYAESEMRSLRESFVALRRIGTVEDIASAVGFFACDASSYITGQEIRVDGGFLYSSHMLVQPQRHAYAKKQPW